MLSLFTVDALNKPLLLLCQQHLGDPVLRVDLGVRGGLSHQRGRSLQWVPKMKKNLLFIKETL